MVILFAMIDTIRNYTEAYNGKPVKTLTRTGIVKKMKADYPEMKGQITDKKIRVRLDAICDYEDKYKVNKRTICYREYLVDNGEQIRRTDYYYNDSITDIEYMFLIDSIMNSKIFDTDRANDFAHRVQKFGNEKLKKITSYVDDNIYGRQRYMFNTDVLDNISIIENAIRDNAIIEFDWNVYDAIDGKVGLRFLERRKLKPLRLLLNEGRYYMLARYYKSEKVYTYSIDLMKNVKTVVNGNVPDIVKTDPEKNFKRAEYILSHPYNMGGKIRAYKLRVNREFFSRLVDAFSYGIRILKGTETQNTVDVMVKASSKGMKYWLLHNYDVATLIDNNDKELTEELKKAVKILQNMYS